MLRRDEANHAYFWDEKPVPGVTSTISPLTDYGMIKKEVLEKARQEGQHIHKMVELDCLGQQMKLPGWMHPYFAAWQKFKVEVGFELWESEQLLYHKLYRYAGQFDLAGRLLKFPKVTGGALLDVKRSFFAGPAIGVQLAAYEAARNSERPKERQTRARFGLQLRPDGTYRLNEYTDEGDFAVFLACLTLRQWRAQHRKDDQ